MSEKVDVKEMVNARRARGMLYLENGFEPKEINFKTCLESEIYLWQILIIDHPDHREKYQKAIGENLDKIKELENDKT
jgi:hypothetical protein